MQLCDKTCKKDRGNPCGGGRTLGGRRGNPSGMNPQVMLEHVRSRRQEFVGLVSELCSIESPTDRTETQAAVQASLTRCFSELGWSVRLVRGRGGAGRHLLAIPRDRPRGSPIQMLVGHTDTVWPVGTLNTMPVQEQEGRLHGPGTVDMKGGVAMMVIALRTLRELNLTPPVTPIVFLNSDEEVGSPGSKHHVARLARAVDRAFVLEPAMGPQGLIKTARKGIGRFDVRIRGRASHAGLAPEEGASAIQELATVVERLHAMNDPSRGTTVNVGVVSGGTRANVVAAEAHAAVDVRVMDSSEGRRIEEAVGEMKAVTSGVSLEIRGGISTPPLERTPRNCQLWERARGAGREMAMVLEDAMAGGGSDGNTTSQYTATLDGLGCVGDGAHADHEHLVIDASLDRCALLARLLMEPADKWAG